MSFDWQTEEDDGWDNPDFASSDSSEKKSGGKRRRWRWLIPVGLLVVALTAAGWTLNQRVQTVAGQVEVDILASYELVEQAVAQRDDEVFRSLLSGRDNKWANEMTRVVKQGSLTDRSGLGLSSLLVTEPMTPTVEMEADLLAAEVTTVRPYTIEIGNGLTETVELIQTAVYRLGPNRWLLSPPDIAFWGGVYQLEGRYVTIFYPERDKEIAQALLLSLDEKIGQLCAQMHDGACLDGYHLIVELSTEPAAFTQLNLIPVAMNADRRHLILPTPTLVGLPLDQAGENALFRGYGRLVAAAVLTDLWEYDCCEDGIALFVAVLEDRLRHLGLQSWPGEVGTAVPTKEYDALLAEGVPLLFDSQQVWEENAQDVKLLCHIGGEERMAFYRYSLADGVTQFEQPLNREVNVMVALPDDNGLAVWETGFSDDLTSIFLWADGMKTAVSWDAADNAPGPVPMRTDPSHTKLLLAPAMVGQANYGLLDTAGCLDGDCRLDTLNGYPTWSPDLAHMILLNTEDFRAHMARARGELILTDGLGEELEVIGAGSSPFWLNNEAYGFVPTSASFSTSLR